MIDPKSQNFLDDLLTTTPGASDSATIAKGNIAKLTARDPALAAQLAVLGTQLRSAGVSGGEHFSATTTLSTPSVPDARTAEQVLEQVDRILGREGITEERALKELRPLFGGLTHKLQGEIAAEFNTRLNSTFPPEEHRGMSISRG